MTGTELPFAFSVPLRRQARERRAGGDRDGVALCPPSQREVLGALEELVVRGGFVALKMAEIAARLGCSLRTLYGISP